MKLTQQIPGLEEAVERAWAARRWQHEPSLELLVAEAVNTATYVFVDTVWDRDQSCDDAECPNRPAWDIELDAASGAMALVLGKDVEALIRSRLAEFAVSFQAAHPDAVLRPAEEAAA